MTTATVGEIQKNFAGVLRNINGGEEIIIIIITKRGKPVAKITSLGPKTEIKWPDFYNEAIELKGKPAAKIIIESREDRF